MKKRLHFYQIQPDILCLPIHNTYLDLYKLRIQYHHVKVLLIQSRCIDKNYIINRL